MAIEKLTPTDCTTILAALDREIAVAKRNQNQRSQAMLKEVFARHIRIIEDLKTKVETHMDSGK